MVRLLEPWRTRLLWLSMALNVFALALIVAPHIWHQGPGGPPGPPSFDTMVRRIARGLAPGDATAFKESMAKERPWYELGRQRMDEARANVAEAVGRTPYDPAAASAALQSMQELMREGGARFDDSLVTAFGALSPEGRGHLAVSLRQNRR